MVEITIRSTVQSENNGKVHILRVCRFALLAINKSLDIRLCLLYGIPKAFIAKKELAHIPTRSMDETITIFLLTGTIPAALQVYSWQLNHPARPTFSHFPEGGEVDLLL